MPCSILIAMPDMNGKNVALLIDFENLVYGLRNDYPENYENKVDPELLMRVSEEYGQVILANAYADWRGREVNQFQTQLYSLGVELIHVFGRRYGGVTKNAVDVKMAVDAVEMLWKYGHIDTFVIVSGDRDFIHVLKALRRNGKRVIGIATDSSASADFAELCDRFIRYDSLASAMNAAATGPSPAQRASLDQIKEVLLTELSKRPSGMKGAQVKPLLRRMIAPTFDESEYGYGRMSDLLFALGDVIRVDIGDGSGDVTLFPASTPIVEGALAAKAPRIAPDAASLARASGLSDFRFTSDRNERRRILDLLYRAMTRGSEFTQNGVIEEVLSKQPELSTTVLAKYIFLLWQSRVFIVAPNQHDKALRDRRMTLIPDLTGPEALIKRYEMGAIYKVVGAAGPQHIEVGNELVAELLGLDATDEGRAEAQMLLEAAKAINRG